MGAQLNRLIRACAEAKVKSLGTSSRYSREAREEVINALSNQWREDIKKEIIDELTEAEKAKIDKQIQEHSTKRDIENLRSLVCEGIFLAVIVGVLVNQITDLVTNFKDGEYSIIITWVIILVLGAGVWGYILFRLAATIGKLLGNKESDDEDHS